MRGGLLLAAVVMAACGTQARWQPSDAMARSGRILRQLDRLEADLHASNADTQTYAELVERHGQAQEIACKVTDEHVNEIHRLAMAQEAKLQQKRVARAHRKKAIAQLRTGYSKS